MANDLLVNLFKENKAVINTWFCQYTEGKEDGYNKGQPITAQTPMELAEAKYQILYLHNLRNSRSHKARKAARITIK